MSGALKKEECYGANARRSKKNIAGENALYRTWQSFRSEMDPLFDRFSSSFRVTLAAAHVRHGTRMAVRNLFQRSFWLPDGIDRDKIAAESSKGVRTLTLPKTQAAQKQQKKIEVKGG